MARAWAYASDALGSFARQGATHIQLWCVEPGCLNRERLAIDRLIARWGPEMPLIMIARKARCRRCGRRGCHVQPAPPPAQGQPGHREWQQRHGGQR